MLRTIFIVLLLMGCQRSQAEPALVEPPSVKGEGEGFVLTYFDTDGVHSAKSRSDIPDANRQYVRVQPADPTATAPNGTVFVADMREDGPQGYPVFSMGRSELEKLIDKAAGAPSIPNPDDAKADLGVTLYGTAWCGACRAARKFLTEQGVAFRDLDIEKTPGARQEMQRKLKASGRVSRGVPVIDVRGKLLTGFDPQLLSAALKRGTKL